MCVCFPINPCFAFCITFSFLLSLFLSFFLSFNLFQYFISFIFPFYFYLEQKLWKSKKEDIVTWREYHVNVRASDSSASITRQLVLKFYKKFWRINRRPMVTLPALSPVDPHVHSPKIPKRPSTRICVTKTLTIWSNILTNVVTLSRKIFWVFWRIYRRPMVIQRHPPLPPLRRQQVNLRVENRENVMQYFGYVVTLAHLGLRWTVSCVLMDVRYGVFPLKTRFNTSAAWQQF